MAAVAGKLFEAEHAAVDAIMGNLDTNQEAQAVLGNTIEPVRHTVQVVCKQKH